MNDIEYKCCCCGKKININENIVPPSWYGKFEGSNVIVSIICSVCIEDPKNLKTWQNKA